MRSGWMTLILCMTAAAGRSAAASEIVDLADGGELEGRIVRVGEIIRLEMGHGIVALLRPEEVRGIREGPGPAGVRTGTPEKAEEPTSGAAALERPKDSGEGITRVRGMHVLAASDGPPALAPEDGRLAGPRIFVRHYCTAEAYGKVAQSFAAAKKGYGPDRPWRDSSARTSSRGARRRGAPTAR